MTFLPLYHLHYCKKCGENAFQDKRALELLYQWFPPCIVKSRSVKVKKRFKKNKKQVRCTSKTTNILLSNPGLDQISASKKWNSKKSETELHGSRNRFYLSQASGEKVTDTLTECKECIQQHQVPLHPHPGANQLPIVQRGWIISGVREHLSLLSRYEQQILHLRYSFTSCQEHAQTDWCNLPIWF